VIVALSDAGHPLWFFWYVAIGAAVAFAVILTLKETNGTELR
jgi:MHS family alpha-ketoglutarate permease-like MFS transporter